MKELIPFTSSRIKERVDNLGILKYGKCNLAGEVMQIQLRAIDVAREAGISKNTLLRWLKTGKVSEVARDRNGWRIFSREDAMRIKAYANQTTPPASSDANALGGAA